MSGAGSSSRGRPLSSWASRSSTNCRPPPRPRSPLPGAPMPASPRSSMRLTGTRRSGARLQHAGAHPRAQFLRHRRRAHPGRHAGLWLCQGGQSRCQEMAGAAAGYLRGRPGLARVFVLIDARHGVKAADEEMFGLLDEAAVTYQIVLTKTDKIKASRTRGRHRGDKRDRQEAPRRLSGRACDIERDGRRHRRTSRRDRGTCERWRLKYKRRPLPAAGRTDHVRNPDFRNRPHPVGGAALPAAL